MDPGGWGGPSAASGRLRRDSAEKYRADCKTYEYSNQHRADSHCCLPPVTLRPIVSILGKQPQLKNA
jgi:hypothetical protein